MVFYPAEIVNAAAGFAYGFFPALALVTVAWVLSGLPVTRSAHDREAAARPLAGHRALRADEAMIERGGVTLLLAVRLIPIVPFSLVSYAAGAARVPLWRFVWTTVVGYMPITALAVYFGTRLEGLSLTDPLVIGSAAALLALLLPATGSCAAPSRRSRRLRSADLLDPEAEDGRRAVDVAGRVAGFDPTTCLPTSKRRESLAPQKRSRPRSTLQTRRRRLVGAEAEGGPHLAVAGADTAGRVLGEEGVGPPGVDGEGSRGSSRSARRHRCR